jgi:hypothetical protein
LSNYKKNVTLTKYVCIFNRKVTTMIALKKLSLLILFLLVQLSESSERGDIVTPQFEKNYLTLTRTNRNPTFAQMVSCNFVVTENFETNPEKFNRFFQEMTNYYDRVHTDALNKGNNNSAKMHAANLASIPLLQKVVTHNNMRVGKINWWGPSDYKRVRLLSCPKRDQRITFTVFNHWFTKCLSENNLLLYNFDRQSKTLENEFKFMHLIANLISLKINNDQLLETTIDENLFNLIAKNKFALGVLEDFGFELARPLWYRLAQNRIVQCVFLGILLWYTGAFRTKK